MRAFLAATDLDWFEFLSRQGTLDEVNFWYPKPWGGHFQVLKRGEPLLFKLKRPYNAIGGGGFFVHYTELPLSLAWSTFGPKNGAPSHLELWRKITNLRRELPRPGHDPTIGCVLLAEPFFWPREMWIPDPPGWSASIQRGKSYHLREPDGRWIWERVVERLQTPAGSASRAKERPLPAVLPGGFGDPLPHTPRLGQGIFRAVVTDAYRRRCAVTQEKALPALDAAHIRPFSEVGEHRPSNGILLRSDVHRLFDAGYLTVTADYRLEASRRLTEDFDDGENYRKLHGRRIWVPEEPELRPDPEALRWHNEARFRG